MNAKHTPGPWVVEYIRSPVPGDTHEFRVSAKIGGIIAWVDTKANVKLFVSAPNLLAERDRLRLEVRELRAALEGVLAYEDDYPPDGTFGAEIYANARAALAKSKEVQS